PNFDNSSGYDQTNPLYQAWINEIADSVQSGWSGNYDNGKTQHAVFLDEHNQLQIQDDPNFKGQPQNRALAQDAVRNFIAGWNVDQLVRASPAEAGQALLGRLGIPANFDGASGYNQTNPFYQAWINEIADSVKAYARYDPIQTQHAVYLNAKNQLVSQDDPR